MKTIQEILILEDRNGIFERDFGMFNFIHKEMSNSVEYTRFELALDYINLFLDEEYIFTAYEGNVDKKLNHLVNLKDKFSTMFVTTLLGVLENKGVQDHFNGFDLDEIELLKRVQDLIHGTHFLPYSIGEEIDYLLNLGELNNVFELQGYRNSFER